MAAKPERGRGPKGRGGLRGRAAQSARLARFGGGLVDLFTCRELSNKTPCAARRFVAAGADNRCPTKEIDHTAHKFPARTPPSSPRRSPSPRNPLGSLVETVGPPATGPGPEGAPR